MAMSEWRTGRMGDSCVRTPYVVDFKIRVSKYRNHYLISSKESSDTSFKKDMKGRLKSTIQYDTVRVHTPSTTS